MHSWAEKLLALQDAQIRMARLQNILDGLPAEKRKAEAGVEKEMASVRQCQEDIKAHELAVRQLETQIESIRVKKKDFQAKSSLIKNNDEYRAALLQIEQCDASVLGLEDRQLAEMEEQEVLRPILAERQEALASARRRADAAQRALDEQGADLAARIKTLAESLPGLQEGIDPVFLKEYLRLRSAQLIAGTDPVLVPIDGESCGGCRMKVTMQLINNAVNGKLTCCPSCHAMLYSEE